MMLSSGIFASDKHRLYRKRSVITKCGHMDTVQHINYVSLTILKH